MARKAENFLVFSDKNFIVETQVPYVFPTEERKILVDLGAAVKPDSAAFLARKVY